MSVAFLVSVGLGLFLGLALFGIPWTMRLRRRQALIGHRRQQREAARAYGA